MDRCTRTKIDWLATGCCSKQATITQEDYIIKDFCSFSL